MAKLFPSDIALLRAAASLAAHAPERMRAAHLSTRLEELARRLDPQVREHGERAKEDLPLAA